MRETEKTGQIYAAMLKAQSEFGAVGKHKENTFDRYKFRSIDDLYEVAHRAFVAVGIFCVPTLRDERGEDRPTKNDGAQRLVHVTVEYRFYAADGSSVAVTAGGEGSDRGDKALNKAMSSAYKNALFQTFAIPLAGADEAETESPDLADAPTARAPAKPAPTKRAAARATEPAPEPKGAQGEQSPEFLVCFSLDTSPPEQPTYRRWKEDAAARSGSMEGRTWGELAEGSFGGRGYLWLRQYHGHAANANTKQRIECTLWEIERQEHIRREQFAAFKDGAGAARPVNNPVMPSQPGDDDIPF